MILSAATLSESIIERDSVAKHHIQQSCSSMKSRSMWCLVTVQKVQGWSHGVTEGRLELKCGWAIPACFWRRSFGVGGTWIESSLHLLLIVPTKTQMMQLALVSSSWIDTAPNPEAYTCTDHLPFSLRPGSMREAGWLSQNIMGWPGPHRTHTGPGLAHIPPFFASHPVETLNGMAGPGLDHTAAAPWSEFHGRLVSRHPYWPRPIQARILSHHLSPGRKGGSHSAL
jgi:hypothetical protein